MKKLTENPVSIPGCGSGHLYRAQYGNGKTAIIIGEGGGIGRLSVNIENLSSVLGENDFFVKLYSEGEIVNAPCFETGLFEKISEPISIDGSYGTFQIWRLDRNL